MHSQIANGMLGFIVRRDQRLMRRLNRWPAPRWIRFWMLAATRAGDGWLWYAMGLMILALGGENRFRAVAAAILAAGSGILLFRAVKKLANRKRPCEYEPHCWARLPPPDRFSLPSRHTVTAFAVAVTLS